MAMPGIRFRLRWRSQELIGGVKMEWRVFRELSLSFQTCLREEATDGDWRRDNHQRICFTLGLWNGKDPILKERLYGLNGNQGNHGEDVKEVYYYLDSTPTHSYMKYLYKYPQTEFPYQQLKDENQNRSREVGEFELMDTDLFDEDRYWDVYVEVSLLPPFLDFTRH